jgi:hypothetical protein
MEVNEKILDFFCQFLINVLFQGLKVLDEKLISLKLLETLIIKTLSESIDQEVIKSPVFEVAKVLA